MAGPRPPRDRPRLSTVFVSDRPPGGRSVLREAATDGPRISAQGRCDMITLTRLSGSRVRAELRPGRAHRRHPRHGDHPRRRQEVRRLGVPRGHRRPRSSTTAARSSRLSTRGSASPSAPARAPRPRSTSRRASLAHRRAAPRGALMDPAPAIGIGLGFVVVVDGQRARGRQPDEPAAAAADAARLRHHDPGHASPAAPWPTPSTCRRLAQARLHRQGRPRAPTSSPTVVALAERARREGLLALEDGRRRRRRRRSSSRASRWPSTAPTPRSCATSSRREVHAKRSRGQAGGQVLRRRRRLRPDDRHHRHRDGPGARAGEPRQARGARPPDRRRRSSPPCGASPPPT